MTSHKKVNLTNVISHNENAWDIQAIQQHVWSQPVSAELIDAAKNGKWYVHITQKPLPESWLPKDISGKDILCLASAGGQQAPVLAAAGANVTVFDLSEKQLDQDKMVAMRDNLTINTVQGDMADLSEFESSSFDYIIHPISNLYVADLSAVWQECYRVLRQQGILLASFYNPVLFVFDRTISFEHDGLIKPKYSLPYSDLQDLDQKYLDEKVKNNEAIVFGHTLTDQINGQIAAGFLLSGFYEDDHPKPRFILEKYMQTMIATKAIKL
ncbi:MAG: class I SAM-dependent methyltransferase [Legionellaceae bacterium]|nr:class I SAM-dependent methyltransferase [Legionellaceae bacterium]